MNKTAIKNFAIWARVQLIEAAKQRAFEYEITDGGENKSGLDAIGGKLLSKAEKEQRSQLISEINQKGFSLVMEEAAYTWFNRFIALRFMEVNGYLPSKVRVFTDENGAFKPEILKQAMSVDLEGLDRSKVLVLLDKQDNEELFKYLIITQCNALNAGLPYIFEKIANWTELLFPTNLLRQDSVIGRLISDIAIEDWDNEVEIIGWLYQYYISEKHEEVVDPLHGKVVNKDDIPAATQLFTTDWVVRYILDNSLGRYWIERHPESKLAEKLKYYVTPKDGIIPTVNERINPEELKVLDPCVGSGHFLSYAFDILLEIYRESGWSDRDAAKSIIENNLYGLDIDDRAAQLACFAVMMKARKYNRRIINADTKLHILAMQDSTSITDELIKYVSKHDSSIRNDLNEIRLLFSNAKEYGSIIAVPKLNFGALYTSVEEVKNIYADNLMDMALQREANERLLPLIQQAEILAGKYDVVATNPPYMNKYSARLKAYLSEHYNDYNGDLFSVFIFRNFGFCKRNGYSGFMTPMVWMFIKTYEALRQYIVLQKSITTLIQFEYSAFEEATVPICSFVLKNGQETTRGLYFNLSAFRGGMEVQRCKVEEAIKNKDCGYYYEADEKNYSKIPSSPIAYYASEPLIRAFEGKTIKDYGYACIGMRTGDNARFLRLWQEVSFRKLLLGCKSASEQIASKTKWIPYNKGGEFRKWYGNNNYVVNWENNGEEIKDNTRKTYPQLGDNLGWKISNEPYYYKKGITWSGVTSGTFSCRCYEDGFIFDSGANGLFSYAEENRYYLAGFLNTKLGDFIIKLINPTINTGSGTLNQLPVVMRDDYKGTIVRLVKQCIELSKPDWDSFENSWDFKKHPLVFDLQLKEEYVDSQWAIDRITKCSSLSWLFEKWKQECNARFEQLKANEEELNRIFIEIYGLQDELTPDIEDRDVTVRKADLQRDIKSLISYAVGCMFGRYSVDNGGLCYAGGDWDASKYKTIIPDEDNIIPICDDDYFDDDIVGKFVDFVRKVYGEETLEQNLRFIADALGGKGTSREVIRNYFLNDFFADHCSTYSVTGSGKRPIYWLFSSGKKNGFKALIYMHRYQPDLLARMRTDYVHEQQERYRTQLQMLEISAQTAVPSERVKLNKQITKLKDQSLEIQKYEEKIHHLADQMISIDLDDGVKVNYAKFQDVLEKIK